MNPIIIVGSGLSGYTLAREFRKHDKDTPLRIITADDGRFYSKPMLSNALSNGRTPDQLATADATQMAAQLNAVIQTHSQVNAIDTARHIITVDGQELEYAKLVLALGADVIKPPLKGDAADAVMSVNDLGDYTRFRAVIADAKHVAIIGAGLIGCEFANDLRSVGIAVDVISTGNAPLNRLLPEAAGHALQEGLAQIGVNWHIDKAVTAVDRAAQDYRLTLSDGSSVEADAVLSCVGLRPRTTLANAAGIHTVHGIAVDRFLATSAPDVYAMGDCAEVEGLVLFYVMPLMNAARALAKTLAGEPTPVAYPPMPVVVKTPAHPVVVSPPSPGVMGVWKIEGLDTGVRALFFDGDNKLRGFALTGTTVSEKNALVKELPALL
ncbi:MAG: FAD-dependent oxidoreductase [Gammaproteobacteria bacterium]